MRAALIVPTLDKRELLAHALESALRQTVPVSVVVVDNGSRDGTAAMVAERFPDVILIRNEENLGFGRAVNRGAAAVLDSVDVVIVTNNDVILEPEFSERILEPFADPDVAMVAGVLTQMRAPERVDTAGIELDATLGAWDYLMNQPTAALANSTAPPALPCGGAAAYRAAHWRATRGFDETLFAYSEDVDLGLRIRALGGRCAFAPAARAEHHHGATLGASSPFQRQLHAFGRGYLLGKYGVLDRGAVSRLEVALLDWPTLLVHLVVRRELAPIRERRRGLRAGRARRAETDCLFDLARVPFGDAVGRQFAWLRARLRGGLPAHFARD
jgi:GT2 family glycosyltransferase